MDESSLISYLVVGLFGFLFALVLVSVVRRRGRGRNMIEHDLTAFSVPPALSPPGNRSTLELGRELAPEIERLIRAGDRPGAIALVRARAGLGQEEAARTVDIMARLM